MKSFFTILNKLIKIFIVIGFEEYEAWAVDFFPFLSSLSLSKKILSPEIHFESILRPSQSQQKILIDCVDSRQISLDAQMMLANAKPI